jgi:ATP-binding cassette subfamily C (CFTR/MRP) protein 4
MILLNFLFEKVTNLSSFSIKEANIGKILNIISGDINQLEYYFVRSFFFPSIPGALTFAIIILWVNPAFRLHK